MSYMFANAFAAPNHVHVAAIIAKKLRDSGFSPMFHIGEPVEHRGKRQAVALNLSQTLNNLKSSLPYIWACITDSGRIFKSSGRGNSYYGQSTGPGL